MYNIKGRFNYEFFQKNEKILSVENVRDVILDDRF